MNDPVQAVIGLGLDVKGAGWDKLHSALDKHAQDWNTVEGSVNRIGAHVDSLASRLLQLGGAVGVGVLVNDFFRLESAANRAALAVGNVTGDRNGYMPIGQQLLGASRATGINPNDLGAAITALQTRAGGTYLGGPGAIPAVARALGTFSGAYSIDPQALAQQLGSLELFQRQNPGSSRQLMQELAAQAAGSGMAGQTGLFTSTVAGTVSSLIGAHPASAGPGANIRVGAMYGAAQSVNPAFRDPGVFNQAVGGVDQAITGAYQNPRLQAVMQMAGIGYRDQRGGLAGPHGPEIAQKLLAWSAAQYGQGSIAQDMFLRSNFGGNVGADFLQALAAGHGTQQALNRVARSPGALAAQQGQIDLRSRQYQQTPEAMAQKGRSTIEEELYGLFGNTGLDMLNFVTSHPLESIAGAYAGKKLLGFGLRRGAGAVGRRFASRAAARAATEGVEQAGRAAASRIGGSAAASSLEELAARAGGSIPEMSSGFFAGGGGAAADSASAAAGGIFQGGLAALGLRVAGATVGSYAGFMLFPDSTESAAADLRNPRVQARKGRGHAEQQVVNEATRKFGNGWWTNPKALGWAQHRLASLTAGATPSGRRKAQKDLRDAIARTAREQARVQRQVGREGPTGSAVHDLLGLIPGVGPGLGGLFGLGAHALEQHGSHDGGAGMLGLLGHAFGQGDATAGGGAMAFASAKKFDKAVDKFAAVIAAMGGLPGMGGAAYHGGGPGMLNAAGLSGGSDLIGSSMILARAIGGGSGGSGGSGGGGMSLASFQGNAIGATGGGGSGGGGSAHGGPASFRAAANAAGSKFGIHPGILMAIAEVETGFWTNRNTSSAGALGPMQFMPSTWRQYGHGGNIYSIHDSVFAAARYLRASGGMGNIRQALYDYNHSWAYVDDILRRARKYGYNPGSGSSGSRTSKAAGGGSGTQGGGDGLAAALAWQAGGGAASGGGMAGVGAGGPGSTINVNVDGRRVDHYRAVTRRGV